MTTVFVNSQGKPYTINGKPLVSPEYDGTTISYAQYGESIANVTLTGKSGASNIALPNYTIVSSVNGCMGASGNTYLVLGSDNQPHEKAGLLSTTDDGSARTWYLFYNNGFVLDTTPNKSGYLYCGSVNLSAHTVYPAYQKGSWNISGSLSYTGYKLGGFNSSNKITTTYQPSITPEQLAQGFCIQIRLKTGSTLSNQWIISNNQAWNTGIGMTINADLGNKFWIRLANSDNSVAWAWSATSNLSTNTEYWVRLIKSEGDVDTYLQTSTDGVNWTTEASKTMTLSSTFTTAGTYTIGNLGTGGEYFRGSVDIRDTFIEIAGTRVWGLTLEG